MEECALPGYEDKPCKAHESFADPRDDASPDIIVPRPLPAKIVLAPLATDRSDILHGQIRPADGGLICTD